MKGHAAPVKGLAYQETARILRRIGSDDHLVLIGGQAVNYWASRYSNSESELHQHAPYTSKDVDFCGSQESLARCAARLHGTSELYTMDQRTAAFGVVRFRDSVGEERWIDVMRSPFGVSAVREIEIRRWAAPMTTSQTQLAKPSPSERNPVA